MSDTINEVTNRIFSGSIENGRIKVPEWTKRVKLDVGTSLNAPNSEKWLDEDSELCVFGFEPNIYNIDIMKTGIHKWPVKLKLDRIDKSFFCFNCALSDFFTESADFYCTDDVNSGTSSLYKPIPTKINKVDKITKVPVIRLSDFFDLFPWDRIPHIDQVKIDAQSSDFNIVRGMGGYLSQKVVYLDVETSTYGQYENTETPEDLRKYIEDQGFECISWGGNGSFRNKRFSHIYHTVNYNFLND